MVWTVVLFDEEHVLLQVMLKVRIPNCRRGNHFGQTWMCPDVGPDLIPILIDWPRKIFLIPAIQRDFSGRRAELMRDRGDHRRAPGNSGERGVEDVDGHW